MFGKSQIGIHISEIYPRKCFSCGKANPRNRYTRIICFVLAVGRDENNEHSNIGQWVRDQTDGSNKAMSIIIDIRNDSTFYTIVRLVSADPLPVHNMLLVVQQDPLKVCISADTTTNRSRFPAIASCAVIEAAPVTQTSEAPTGQI
jgi:hypothetical protein